MNEDYYLHAINADCEFFDYYATLCQLDKILKSGALLSMRNQKRTNGFTCFAGLDYISLGDYSKRHITKEPREYNAYNIYIKNSLSLMFPKEIVSVEQPILIKEICSETKEGYRKMMRLGNSTHARYSDMPDEVQVRDLLLLNKMCGIALPIGLIKQDRLENEAEYINNIVTNICELLDSYNYNVPIYDVETLEVLRTQRGPRLVLKGKKS